jgi:hypothetical protein
MGKKSRRNRTVATSAGAAAAASDFTDRCFHGSTIDKFQQPNSEYMKAAEEYYIMRGHFSNTSLTNVDNITQRIEIFKKYDNDHNHLTEDPEFSRFIFAYCTERYLGSKNFQEYGRRQEIWGLLSLGLMCRYCTTSEEWVKYHRDIDTDRGIIKCLVRETATYCDCMKQGRGIARTMEKVGRCHGCKNEFPKETLSFCNGCQVARYHNHECQIDDWPNHKSACKQVQEGRSGIEIEI